MKPLTHKPSGNAAATCIPHADARWNYAAHIIEGGLFVGGMALLNAETVLPPIIKKQGGPTWLIAATPILMSVGYGLPPLFVAHLIDRLDQFKRLPLLMGLGQRLPYLLAGLILLLAPDMPALALVAVVLAPLINGLSGGVASAAWRQLLVKTVPTNRRPSLFAIRNIIGCICGLIAGGAIGGILARWPGVTGYGILHLAAFVLLMGSYVIFACVRETGDHPPREERSGLVENLRVAAGMLRGHRELQLLLGFTICRAGLFVFLPFMAIHALAAIDAPEEYLGTLVVWQMVGGIAGNLLAGWLGDRRGAKLIGILGMAGLAVMAAGAVLPSTPVGFCILFAAFGFSFFLCRTAGMSLPMELLPNRRRSTFLALLACATVVSQMSAAALATVLKGMSVPFSGIAMASAVILMLGSAMLAVLPNRTA